MGKKKKKRKNTKKQKNKKTKKQKNKKKRKRRTRRKRREEKKEMKPILVSWNQTNPLPNPSTWSWRIFFAGFLFKDSFPSIWSALHFYVRRSMLDPMSFDFSTLGFCCCFCCCCYPPVRLSACPLVRRLVRWFVIAAGFQVVYLPAYND